MKLTNNIYYYPEAGMLDCNTYVIKDKTNIIIDPGLGDYIPVLEQSLNQDGINPKDIGSIVNTHLHGDHCWGNQDFQKISGAKMLFHPLQRKFFDITVGRTSALFGMSSIGLKEDGYLDNRLTTGNLEFEILLTPGHSLDSICFYCKKEKIMICGDVVFSGSTGRVDLPGGNAEELKKSIEMIAKLDIEYLLPGHMDIIEGKERVKKNFEFVRKVVFPWL